MILPDVNLLVYAVDESSAYHFSAKTWWDEALSSTTVVGLCYPTMLGFIRLVTNRQIFTAPLSITEATDYIADWLAQPNVTIVLPTPRHWPLLKSFLLATGVGANLTTDSHIATLAVEHGYTVYSNDNDFARFAGLRWENPLLVDR